MSQPIWQQIFEDVKEAIESGRYTPDLPFPSETELAETWKVSRLTAHRALYELQRAGLVMRKRKVGTVVLPPKPPASTRIAALFFHSGDYFQGTLLGSLRAALDESVHLSYVDTDREAEKEASALQQMSEESDGIVLFPTCHANNNELIESLSEAGLPIICIDRHPPGVRCDSVQTDNYGATFEALRELTDQGHLRIACFCDYEEPVSSTSDRIRAYRDLLEIKGGDPRAHFHAFPYLAPDSDSEFLQMVGMVREALSASLAGENPPTAIFCSREHYAGAVIEACHELSISVPSELVIIAFVDRPAYLFGLPDSVRRISQDLTAIGRIAADRVLRRVKGENLPVEHILVPALKRPVMDKAPSGAKARAGSRTKR
jgi:DNA-binding LacI/PurR family transcriptional regulator